MLLVIHSKYTGVVIITRLKPVELFKLTVQNSAPSVIDASNYLYGIIFIFESAGGIVF